MDAKHAMSPSPRLPRTARPAAWTPSPWAQVAAFALVLFSGALTAQTAAEEAALAEPETKIDNPFWDNATAGYFFRFATFKRTSHGDLPALRPFTQEGVGIGGWLYGSTGKFKNILSLGGAGYFTLPLFAPPDYPYNYILQDPYQRGYAAVGEAYAKLSHENKRLDIALIAGLQSINNQWFMDGVYRFFNKLDQSMIGRRDVRAMHPITYEGVTLNGKFINENLRWYLGYAGAMRQINDTVYRNLYQGAYQTTVWPTGAKNGDSNGMVYGQINWKPEPNTMISASYHQAENLLNMGYLDVDHVFRFADKKYFRVDVQWMYQDSNGDSLVSGSNGNPGQRFNTNYGGIYLEGRPFPWWIPYAAAGITAQRSQIRAPWSIGPSFLVQRIGENSLAGEHTWILGTVIDFSSWGLKDLSLDVTYGERSHRNVDNQPDLPMADWNEVATDLIYIFPQNGFFKNLRARARYAKVWQSGPQWVSAINAIQQVSSSTEDIRFDIGLNIPFF